MLSCVVWSIYGLITFGKCQRLWIFAGSGVGNLGEVRAEEGPHHGQPASASVTVPPLATLWLRPS